MKMLPRTPHTDLQVISGAATTENYLEMQKKQGRLYLAKFLNLLEKQDKTGKFLEIGPGPGYQTVQVANRIKNSMIVALEPSADMIKVASEFAQSQKMNGRITYVQGIVEDEVLMASLGRFDLIYSTFSLHHWQEPIKAFANLYKALKPGGTLVIYDFIRHWSTYYLPLHKGLKESLRAAYTVKELQEMFNVVSINTCEVKNQLPMLQILIKK